MTPKRRNRKNVEQEEDKKVCERLTSMRTIIGKRRPYDRYDMRSRDCHTTDAHVSEKFSNGTSGGASNLVSQEDLELI